MKRVFSISFRNTISLILTTIAFAMIVASGYRVSSNSVMTPKPVAISSQRPTELQASKASGHSTRLAQAAGLRLDDTLSRDVTGQNRRDRKPLTVLGTESPAAPTITATLQDSFTDGDGDMKAEPGQTVTYTVHITPSADAAGATGVAYNHSVDSHTSLVASSIRTTPVARPDTYTAIGNVRIVLSTVATGVLGNDSDADGDTFTASAGGTSTNGGNVAMNADGTFTYNPPRGFEGTDTFTYTLTDSTGKTDTGIVSVTVAGVIWFIDNNAAGGGDGRLTTPYNTLAAFQAVNNGTGGNPAAGDNIFIYRLVATDYTGPITLLNNQRLIGQGATASILAITGLGTPSGTNQLPATGGTNPNITTTAAATNAINLSVGGSNLLRGFTVGNTTGSKIASGASFGTLTVSEVTLNGSGQALSLTSGTLTASFTSISSTPGAGARGIDLTTVAGTSTFGTGTITGNTAEAFRVNGSNPTITYSGSITQNSAGRVVDIQSTTGGAITFNTGTITGGSSSTGININATNGNVSFANGLTLGTSGSRMTNQAVTITGGTGTCSLGTVSIFTNNAQGLVATNADGTLNTTTGTVDSSNSTAINIDGPAGLTTLGMTLTRIDSSGGTGTGIIIQDTNGTFTVNGDGTNTAKGGNGTGGTIATKTGTDGNFSTGSGVFLNNAAGVTLRRMQLNDFGNRGIFGLSVSNFTLQYSTISGTNGTTAGDLTLEGPIAFGRTSPSIANGFANGSVSTIDNCKFSGGVQHNMEVYQQANTFTLTISNCDITNNSAALGSDGIQIETHTDGNGGTPIASATISVQSCLFNNNKSQALQASALGDSFLDLTINACTIQKTTQGNEGFVIQNASDADMTVHVTNNTFTGILGTNILVGQVALNASSLSNLIGVIKGNTMTVGNATTFPTNRTLIAFFSSTNGQVSTANVLIESNVINTFSDPVNGIAEPLFVSTPDANADPSFTASVLNNVVNISDPMGTSLRGIAIQSTQSVSTACLDVRGNDVNYSPSAPGGVNGLRVRQVAPATIQLERGVSALGTAAATALAANNPLCTTEVVGTVPPVVENNTCQTAPTLPDEMSKPEPAPQAKSITNNDSIPRQQESLVAGLNENSTVENLSKLEHDDRANSPVIASAKPSDPGLLGAYLDRADWLGNARYAVFIGDGSFKEAATVSSTFAQKSNAKKAQKGNLAPQGAGGTVSRTIGDIPQNKTVTITYDVVIDDPAGVTSISTQGTVSGTNFANKVTDDPDTGTANDPTVTPIDLVDTATTVVSSNTSVTAGDLVTFTATIARITGSAGTITGTVQFKEDGNNLGSPAAVTGSGPFTAQLMTKCLTVGSHTITAVYSGDTNFKTSTGTLVGMQSVVKPAVVSVDDSFAGSGCTDLGGGLVLNRNAFQTIAGGQAGVATGGTVNVADGTYAENVTVAMDTVTFFGNVQITGNLTLSGGTLNSTSGTLSITGNFNQTGGAFNHTGGRVAMIGPAAQTLGGTVQTTFNTLTINNTNGVSLGVTKIGVGVLELTLGNLNAGANNYELSASGSISRISGHVLGNLKKTFSGTGAFIFTVGTANGYSPLDVNVTAGTGNLTVKAVQGPQPILNAAKSLQRYWTLSGSGITTNLTFHYIDPTDVPGTSNEAAYRVIRVNGALANIFPDTPPASFVDEAANTINIQNVSAFSDWTAGEPGAPTAVETVSVKATGYDSGTFVEWQTGSEVANLGFNVYRDEGGKRVPVNPQIVAGSALVAGSGTRLSAGRSYSWWDNRIADGGNVQYWIEDIDLNGNRTLHGPVSVRHIGGAPIDRSSAAMLSQVGIAQSGVTRAVAIIAPLAVARPDQISIINSLAGQAAVKLAIKREGFYRVTGTDLFAAGLDPKADPERLQLYADGKQVPIKVATDKQGLVTAVEFYGVGLDTVSTDARVYWLIAGSQAGLRIARVKGSGFATAASSFLSTVERKDRTIYFPALRNGERENFFGAVVAGEPVDQSLALPGVDSATSAQATIEVALQGVTNLQHRVWAYVNGSFAGELLFDGQAQGQAKLLVSQSQLREGDNTVRLVAQGGPSDISLMDYIRVSYWHGFAADDNALRLTVTGGQATTVTGFTSAAVRVFDVTDPDRVEELTAKVEQQEVGYSATFASPRSGERRLLAIADERADKPAGFAANRTSNLRGTNHAADLVIITRRDFSAAFDTLARLRASQGIKTEIVEIEDIYDEFSFGNKSPQAVKDFLQYAKANWKTGPRFVLLAGDSSYDPKNYLGLGDWDIAPAKLIDTGLMETASDDWFADFDNDGLAELAVGRLPVRTADEATAMVAKIVSYESSNRSEEVLLVADVSDTFDFEGANTQLRALIPPNLRVNEIDRGRVDAMTARSQLVEAINRGQKVVNYLGHGSVNLWRGGLLTSEDASLFENITHPSLFIMMTCLNGYSHEPVLDSLAEALMKARGGAIAVWASSGMTVPDGQTTINQEMYRLIFNSGALMTLGEATNKAKATVSDADVRRTWILFGDPTMRLR